MLSLHSFYSSSSLSPPPSLAAYHPLSLCRDFLCVFHRKFDSRCGIRYYYCVPKRLRLFTLQMLNEPIILSYFVFDDSVDLFTDHVAAYERYTSCLYERLIDVNQFCHLCDDCYIVAFRYT